MKSRLPWIVFLMIAAGLACYVWQTGGGLPDRVATHFDAHGVPNGWMTRAGFIRFTIGFGLGLPLILIIVFSSVRFVPVRFVNVPNREHWFSPAQCEQTFAWISRAGLWFACVTTGFVAIVHHFVLEANAALPPCLDTRGLLIAVAVLLVFQIVFMVRLILHFSRPVLPTQAAS